MGETMSDPPVRSIQINGFRWAVHADGTTKPAGCVPLSVVYDCEGNPDKVNQALNLDTAINWTREKATG